jgi:hypothetical protein
VLHQLESKIVNAEMKLGNQAQILDEVIDNVEKSYQENLECQKMGKSFNDEIVELHHAPAHVLPPHYKKKSCCKFFLQSLCFNLILSYICMPRL